MIRQLTTLVCALTPLAALAEPPKVVTDILPVHSLVARVMDGTGAEPGLILAPGASPHDYALSPSEARMVAGADLVVWMGEGLTPWLAGAVENLAGEAEQLELLHTRGWTPLAAREDTDFNAENGGHDDHDHGAIDPHAWLDPMAAAAWTEIIGATLAEADPENAGTYLVNAAEAASDLRALSAEVAASMAPLSGPYLVGHDAFRYFEARYGLEPMGAITLSDAASPGPRHVANLRAEAQAGELACILVVPQSGAQWAELVGENSIVRLVAGDTLGLNLRPGPELYPDLIANLAAAMEGCLSPER